MSARNTYNGAVVHYLDATGVKRAVTVDEREQETWPRRYLLFDLAIPVTERGARAIASTLLAENIPLRSDKSDERHRATIEAAGADGHKVFFRPSRRYPEDF